MNKNITSFQNLLKTALILMLGAILLLGTSCSLMKAGAPADALTGNWEGSITAPDGTEIKVYMEFFKNTDGKYQAHMKVPQQTEDTILINDIVFINQTLTFSVEEAQAVFVGKAESNDTINGDFSQGENLMPAEFKRTD